MTPAELKKELTARGLLVYRTLPEGVALAEYERENLLVDAGIRVTVAPGYGVTSRFRVEQHAFPGEAEEQLFGRARALALGTGVPNMQEIRAESRAQTSPSDPQRVMDTFFEVTYFAATDTLDGAIELARRLIAAARSLGG